MTNHAIRIASPVFALLVSGVAWAQDRPTETAAADRAVAPVRSEVDTESPELEARLGRPLTMEDCIQIALQRNIPLAVAREARDAGEVLAGGSIGKFFPEFVLRGSGERIESTDRPDHEHVFDREAKVVQRLPIGTVVEAGLRLVDDDADTAPLEGSPSVLVTQPLLRAGGWTASTASVRNARYTARIRESSLRAAVLATVYNVKLAYLNLERRSRLIDVNKQGIGRDEELLNFSRAKLEVQLATQRDVLSAEIVLAQDRGRLVNAEANYRLALDSMSEILGVRIARDIQFDFTEPEFQPVETEEDAWVAKALRDNPTIEAVKLACERAELTQRVAGNGRLPQLDVAVGYAQTRTPFGHNPDSFVRAWHGELLLSYPFLNKELGSAYEAAQLDYDQSKRTVVQTERQVILGVRDSVRNLKRGVEQLEILKKNIEGAQSKVEFAKINFQLGRASNLDITDAQRDLLDAETSNVDELVSYREELARLEQLLGGSIRD